MTDTTNPPALPPEMVRAATEAILRTVLTDKGVANLSEEDRVGAQEMALAALQSAGVAEMAAEVERQGATVSPTCEIERDEPGPGCATCRTHGVWWQGEGGCEAGRQAAEVERLRTECDLWASDRKAADLLAQLAAAQGERDNLREVLKGVEWIQDAPCYCPICFSTEEQGHAPACGLQAALADGQGEGKK